MKVATRNGGMLALGLATALAAFIAVRASAAGIPEADGMTYSGYLEDAEGTPLSGEHSVTVQFWQSETGGRSLCTADNSADASLVSGRFQIKLPTECTNAVKASPDVWVSVEVDGSKLTRTKLGAVPYALEAGRATSADVATAAGGPLATRLTDLEESLTKATMAPPWTLAPIDAAAPVVAWPDPGFGKGLEYSNIGPLTCLRGLIKMNAAGYYGTITTLPRGSRPSTALIMLVPRAHGGTVNVELHADGTLSLRDASVPAGDWVSLSGVCFPHQ